MSIVVFLVVRLWRLVAMPGVEADEDRIVLILLLLGEGQHEGFRNDLERRLTAAIRISVDLVNFGDFRLLIALATHNDAQLRGIRARRAGRPDQQMAGDADFDAELIAHDMALARRIDDVELIADRIIGLAADPNGGGAVLNLNQRTVDVGRQPDDGRRRGRRGAEGNHAAGVERGPRAYRTAGPARRGERRDKSEAHAPEVDQSRHSSTLHQSQKPAAYSSFLCRGQMVRRQWILRQLLDRIPEAGKGERDADPLLRRLKDDEGRRLSILHLVDQFVFHHDFGDAAIGQAAHETGAADIGLVDLEAEARGNQHAKRRDDAQQATLAVCRLEHDDDQGDVGTVLRRHALYERALLPRGAGRRFATGFPVAVFGFDDALRPDGRGKSDV